MPSPDSVAHVPPRTARVVALCVTWNRKEMVSRAIEALARQRYPLDHLDLVVIDNASTDGTPVFLSERWAAERIIENPTARAHEPAFACPPRVMANPLARGSNRAGFRSFTVVRNAANHGGCGGFNTGLAFVEHAFGAAGESGAPEYVWLVDDDAETAPDTLEHLTRVGASDPGIGLVGSRTVHFDDRAETIETTIYFDSRSGAMCDHPPPHHPLHQGHTEWVKRTGGVRGKLEFSGARDVDVVSACCMLARWSGVAKVGFWDWRYFIYCDDADWCLRFARAGYRVVLSLDARVFHLPWNLKLTPARIYYAQRNAVWMAQKIVPEERVRPVMLRWLGRLVFDSLRAASCRRLFHADIIRRTAEHIVSGQGGKLVDDGPKPEDTVAALRRTGALTHGGRIGVVCCQHGSLDWARALRDRVAAACESNERPTWQWIVRNDLPGAASEQLPGSDVSRVIYSRAARSRAFRRQLPFVLAPPAAVVIFDQTTDFPFIRGGWNIHIDMKNPAQAQVERDGLGPRVRFFSRWLGTTIRSFVWAVTTKRYVSANRYG
ncbi:MAG: glycosyltransferase family 2 protein [Phycisphaerae bacterium]|nr:glycosyltransferase family 2 protein [Phycisphaerae bacterium]